jgi:hypothetical protein
MKVMLVGGEQDGEQIELTQNKFTITINCKTGELIYERKTFRGNSRMFIVFALTGMSSDEVIEKLIDNYKP